MAGSHQVWVLIDENQLGPFAGAQFFEPEGICYAGERLYIADTNNHQVRVADLRSREVTPFRLRGLERLPEPIAMREDEDILPVVEAAPGRSGWCWKYTSTGRQT